MSPTIKDIAKAAGTDIRVVSLTLRDHPDAASFRQETREKVKRIAREMGYERNRMAAAVRTGIVQSIALVGDLIPTAQNHWVVPSELLAGIVSEANLFDYQVRLFPGDDMEKNFSEIRGNHIQFIICTSGNSTTEEKVAEFCRKYDLSLALLWEKSFSGYPVVNTRITAGSAIAVEHLASLGHKRIGLLTVPERDFFYLQKHRKGFREAMEKASLPLSGEWISEDGDDMEKLKAFLARAAAKGPCAFFCTAESIAVRAIFCARELNLSIPGDLSIVGYGSGKYPAALSPIPLTSVREAPYQQGQMAVDLLLGKNGITPDGENYVYVKPELNIQSTTGAPREP